MAMDGFKKARHAAIRALVAGDYMNEARQGIDVKNLLATGAISPLAVAELLRTSTGNHHRSSPHHADASITVHVVLVRGWYVKFYVLEPDVWFISVHR